MNGCRVNTLLLYERKITMNTIANTSVFGGIKVTVHIPEDIPEYVKREKINYLYEILKPQEEKAAAIIFATGT